MRHFKIRICRLLKGKYSKLQTGSRSTHFLQLHLAFTPYRDV